MAEEREKFKFLRSESFIRIGGETFKCDLTDAADPEAEVFRHRYGDIYFKNMRPTKDN